MPSRRSPLALVALALVVAGCGSTATAAGGTTVAAGGGSPPSGATNDNIPPSAAPTGSQPTASIEDPTTAGRDTEGQILVPGPGFAPPVLRASGVAGGPTEGHDGPMACTGYYPSRPQHVLKVGRTVPMLRVIADGVDRDLTLALRTPDGQWHCNDDSGDPQYGLNPAVEITSARGEIEVYVGVFSDTSSGAQYALGVTEDANRFGSSLRSGPSLPPPSLPPPSLGVPPGMVVP